MFSLPLAYPLFNPCFCACIPAPLQQGSCADRNPLDANTTESYDSGAGYKLKDNPGQIKAWTKTDCCQVCRGPVLGTGVCRGPVLGTGVWGLGFTCSMLLATVTVVR